MNVIEWLRPLVTCLDEMKASCPLAFTEILEQGYDDIGFHPEDVAGRHVIDIGAHVGIFSLLCYAHGAKSILCVEANPVNFRKLVSNLSGIGSMIGFLNCAVFDGSRNHAFMSDNNDKSAMVLQNQPWMVQGQEVKCVSLDQVLSLYDEDVVLKMDIEGGEYATLPSASRTNLRKCKMLFLETHTPPPGTDHLGESRPSSFLKEYVMSSGFTVENEQQFASWDIDGAGNQFNYNVIPNAKSFRFARID